MLSCFMFVFGSAAPDRDCQKEIWMWATQQCEKKLNCIRRMEIELKFSSDCITTFDLLNIFYCRRAALLPAVHESRHSTHSRDSESVFISFHNVCNSVATNWGDIVKSCKNKFGSRVNVCVRHCLSDGGSSGSVNYKAIRHDGDGPRQRIGIHIHEVVWKPQPKYQQFDGCQKLASLSFYITLLLGSAPKRQRAMGSLSEKKNKKRKSAAIPHQKQTDVFVACLVVELVAVLYTTSSGPTDAVFRSNVHNAQSIQQMLYGISSSLLSFPSLFAFRTELNWKERTRIWHTQIGDQTALKMVCAPCHAVCHFQRCCHCSSCCSCCYCFYWRWSHCK